MLQNVSSLEKPSWTASERLSKVAPLSATLVLMALCGFLLQSRFGADADVHWLNDLAGRWLDGQTPYVDFVEINPPASILLYMFPTALARALGLHPDAVTQAFLLIAALADLTIAVVVARRARLVEEFGAAGLFWSAAALFLLPGYTFAERDHFALVFALPVFAVLSARALSRPVDAPWAIAGGVGAGFMLCLRPHYALALAPPAIYALYRNGWRVAPHRPEIFACAAVLAAYAATVIFAFPHFIADMLPIDVAVYARGGAPFVWMFARAWFLVWISLAAALWGTRRSLVASAPSQLLALASCGALASYLVQAKGWAYHIYVADALILSSFAIANRDALRQTGPAALALAVALVAVSVGLASAFLHPGDIPFAVLRTTLSLALMVLSVRLALAAPDDSGPAKPLRWTRLGVAVLALAMGELAMLEGAHPAYFPDQTAMLGPRPKIAMVAGTGGGAGIDFANQTDGFYSPRAMTLEIVELATDRLRRDGPPPEEAAMLNRYIREDRDRFAATVRNDRPDGIIVDRDWARTYLDPGFLRDLLEGYSLRATTKLPPRFLPTPTLQLFTREPGK